MPRWWESEALKNAIKQVYRFYRFKSAKKNGNIPWEIVVKKGTFYFCCQLTAMMSVRNVLFVIIRQKQ